MNQRKASKGLSMVELMVALLLASIITIFVSNIMINSSRSASTSTGLAQAQEAGRLAMAWLGERVPNAGYRNTTFVFDVVDTSCSGAAHCHKDVKSNANGGDVLALRRLSSPGLNEAPQLMQTCAGTTLPNSAQNAPNGVIDVYWIEKGDVSDLTTAFQLKCATYSTAGGSTTLVGSKESIASGIESMQVLYGIEASSQADSGTVERYVNGTYLNSNPNMAARVVAVKIALLSRSFEDDTLNNSRRGYQLLDSEITYANDRVARYINTSTFWLPNMQNR
ncbi:hypothetical protein CHH28_09595 [Bacterioplanes sanyensis]|uniref:Prepilin-type cleavage/methylation domain-containing protein n=1 Tax=Bacterioplanes sanyensis TaxID=1249553 RepID=A0A222FJK8_9GAMM|nr:PilW family protein [Bacterioplanes sanyensis]ASP38919.1 hypothetical protein CHH28_09595 [Bacterioplanes sanyensis]